MDLQESGESAERNRWGVQASTTWAKGKQPMTDESINFRPHLQCAQSGLPSILCRAWSFCPKCHKKGHTVLHCAAQWKKSVNGKLNQVANH
jgi:hypothetical protein